jgi:hypothetical protein
VVGTTDRDDSVTDGTTVISIVRTALPYWAVIVIEVGAATAYVVSKKLTAPPGMFTKGGTVPTAEFELPRRTSPDPELRVTFPQIEPGPKTEAPGKDTAKGAGFKTRVADLATDPADAVIVTEVRTATGAVLMMFHVPTCPPGTSTGFGNHATARFELVMVMGKRR